LFYGLVTFQDGIQAFSFLNSKVTSLVYFTDIVVIACISALIASSKTIFIQLLYTFVFQVGHVHGAQWVTWPYSAHIILIIWFAKNFNSREFYFSLILPYLF